MEKTTRDEVSYIFFFYDLLSGDATKIFPTFRGWGAPPYRPLNISPASRLCLLPPVSCVLSPLSCLLSPFLPSLEIFCHGVWWRLTARWSGRGLCDVCVCV